MVRTVLVFCSFSFLAPCVVPPLSVCTVLSNVRDYVNTSLTVRAYIQHGVHGSYLVSAEKCDGQLDYIHLHSVTPREWPPAAAQRGYTGPYIMEGYLFLSTRHIPHTKQDGPYLEFDVLRIRAQELK